MFGLFKKKSELDTLQAQYEKLMKEAHALSTSDRSASDAKHAEANAIGEKMDKLRAAEGK